MKNKSRQYLLLAIVMFIVAIGMIVGLWLSVKGDDTVAATGIENSLVNDSGTVLVLADASVSVSAGSVSEKSATDLALAEFGLSSESVVPMSASVRLKKPAGK